MWAAAKYLAKRDCMGVPNGMRKMAAEGYTLMVLWNRMMGVPWNRSVTRAAAQAGQRRTVMWLQLFGCPWDILDACDCDDTSCLRWLSQYRQPDDTALMLAAYEGSLPSMLALLGNPFDPVNPVCRWYVSGLMDVFSQRDGHPACIALLVKHGFMPFWANAHAWRMAARRLRLLEAIPQAATDFMHRHRAARTLQRRWLQEYYTPGRPVWHRRMGREFTCLPQIPV